MTRSEEALKTFVGIKRTNDRLNKAVKVDVKNYGLNVNEFTVLEVLFHRGKLQVQQIKELILIANSSTTYIMVRVSKPNHRILSLFCHGLDCEAIILFFIV